MMSVTTMGPETLQILLDDVSDADKAVQQSLADHAYPNVLVQ
jgi:hypothetical protein